MLGFVHKSQLVETEKTVDIIMITLPNHCIPVWFSTGLQFTECGYYRMSLITYLNFTLLKKMNLNVPFVFIALCECSIEFEHFCFSLGGGGLFKQHKFGSQST